MNDDDLPEIINIGDTSISTPKTLEIGSVGSDVITITLPDYADDIYMSTVDTNMASSTYNSIYSGGTITNAASGSVLTNGNSGVNWGTITFSDDITNNANIHISGDNPKLKTDATEIDINELAGVVDAIKQIIDTNELPIFDRAFRDKHEILQKAWEDIKQAYENYRVTEALLKSTGPGDNND